jgi:hypothetical protein
MYSSKIMQVTHYYYNINKFIIHKKKLRNKIKFITQFSIENAITFYYISTAITV